MDAQKTNRRGLRANPRHARCVAFDERIDQCEIRGDKGAIALEDAIAVTQGQDSEKLTRCRVADRGVIFDLRYAFEQPAIASRNPTDAQTGKSQTL